MYDCLKNVNILHANVNILTGLNAQNITEDIYLTSWYILLGGKESWINAETTQTARYSNQTLLFDGSNKSNTKVSHYKNSPSKARVWRK